MKIKQKKLLSNNLAFFVGASLLSTSLCSLAGQPYVMNGSGLTLGTNSSEYSLHSGTFNPAMTSLMIDKDEKWRVGYLPSITTSIELGDVANFSDELNDLIDIIDKPELATDSVDVTLNRFNNLLTIMGEEGYAKNTTSVQLPIFAKSNVLGGSLSADFSYIAQVSARVLDDTLLFNQQNNTFSTNTSLYLKSGLESSFGISYSRPVFSESSDVFSHGQLFLGTKISAINLKLSKQVIWLEGVKNKKVGDVVRDEYDRDLSSSSGVSLDVGAVWDAKKYRVGLTLSNLNKPSFAYNAVGQNCSSIAPNTIESSNCNVAKFFIETKGKLKANEIHEMKPVVTLDALYKITNKWQLMGSLDLAAYNDIVGYDNKHMHIATSYETNSFWLPSPRLGYSKNLVGAKLTTINAGLTFFKCLSLDVMTSQEKTTIDKKSVPRALGFSLSFDESF